MRTAVVHDWLNGMRGGEKVLEEILPLVPDPTIFTLFHVPGSVSPGIERHPIRASFLNRLPFSRRRLPSAPPALSARRRVLRPFRFRPRGLLVSLRREGSARARGRASPLLLPHAGALRVGPVRRLLSARDDALLWPQESRSSTGCGIGTARPCGRSTRYLANSSAVAERIRRHYGRSSDVVAPPVDMDFYSGGRDAARGLSCSQSARSSRTSTTRSRSRRPAASDGPSFSWEGVPRSERLRALATPSVRFLADLDPKSSATSIGGASRSSSRERRTSASRSWRRTACGAPVAALGRGGARDTVLDGVNGVLYAEEGAEGLVRAIQRIGERRFDYTAVRAAALPFARERFAREFAGAVAEVSGVGAPREGRAQKLNT